MAIGIIAKKIGMTRVFNEDGSVTPVTVLQAGPCPVVAVRTQDKDGYVAAQIAWEAVADRKLSKAELGHLKSSGVDGGYRRLVEIRDFTDVAAGDEVTVGRFEPGLKIKVRGVSQGKGFAGTIKRHNFHRGPMSHGSHNKRAPGSIGASAWPSKVIKGQKMPGRMGGKHITQLGLQVVKVDEEKNLLLVKGSVPGHKNGFVVVVSS
ncbi:MAG: ribosomal protein [Thermoleophilia bacterium]|nr:ribosomal protein [Thermoleophilia bacterium]